MSSVQRTHLDIGFTLASTIARTLQFLMFSGNSWIPEVKEQMDTSEQRCWGTINRIHLTSGCISTVLPSLTQRKPLVKKKKNLCT